MPRTQHKLDKLDLLQYALNGAKTERAINYEFYDPEERELIDKDIKEIQRRIKIVRGAINRLSED